MPGNVDPTEESVSESADGEQGRDRLEGITCALNGYVTIEMSG